MKLIGIHPADNMAVALEDIAAGEQIIKYGCVIGIAKSDIAPGQWVHTHNVRTGLSEDGEYT